MPSGGGLDPPEDGHPADLGELRQEVVGHLPLDPDRGEGQPEPIQERLAIALVQDHRVDVGPFGPRRIHHDPLGDRDPAEVRNPPGFPLEQRADPIRGIGARPDSDADGTREGNRYAH